MSRWFRYYDDALNDRKVQSLPGELFKRWVNVLCIASKHGGFLPNVSEVAFGLGRISEAKAAAIVASLAQRELLDPVPGGYFRPHNWEGRQYKSDVSNERVKQHRKRKRNGECNVTSTVTETPPETETETETDGGQRSLTTSSINNLLSGMICEVVDENRWTPPSHCAVSRDRKRIYLQKDTPEWEAYAADFRATHRQEPQPNTQGGKWFLLQGEAA